MRRSHLRETLGSLSAFALMTSLLVSTATSGSAQTFAPLPLRINCGGYTTDIAGSDGNIWLTDRYFSGGTTYASSLPVNGPPIPRQVWINGRAGTATQDFQYSIPVPNGTYRVTLYFVEMQVKAAGKRVFQVLLNGANLLSGLDLFSKAGYGSPTSHTFADVNVSNQTLQIELQRTSELPPVLSAILVEQTAQAPAPTITVSPASVDLKAGKTAQFSAAVTGIQPSTVTWSLSGSLPNLGTISPSGLYTAPSTIPNSGTVTVKATSTISTSVSGTAKANLLPAINITVSPANGTVVSGQTLQFSATVTGTSNTAVTWSASAGSISPSGLFTAPTVSTTTSVQISARSVADSAVENSVTASVTPATQNGPLTYLESGGQVVMEVERGQIVNRSGKTWSAATSIAGFAGSGYLSALPDSGVNYGNSYLKIAPEIQLLVRFTTPGTYYVWARGNATSWANDSIHVGLNDQAVRSGETLTNFAVQTPSVWSWGGSEMDTFARRTLVIPSAGVHKINIWMREDGLHLDRLLLTRNSQMTPTGVGPAESATDSTTPILGVSPGSLTFNAVVGGANPATQNVSIQNLGGQALSWNASATQPWVKFSPPSGQAPATMAVGVEIAGLTAGTHTANLSVNAPGVQGAPKTIPITLNLTAPAPATLNVTPASLSFTGTAGGANPAAQALSITNGGAGSLNWTAQAQSSGNWLKLNTTSGTTPGTVNVSVDLTGLAANTYSGSVTVTSPGAAGSPKVIGVTLTVGAAPAQSLNVSPASMAFSGLAGGANPASQTLSITNGGAGAFSWTVQSNQSWLTFTPASGSTPGSVTVSPKIAGLAAGVHNAVLTVTAAGVSGSPKQVPVTFTVQAAGSGRTFYIAPNGSSGGDGSISRPWDIGSVLAGSKGVRAGDTVYMRGGTYGNGTSYYNAFLSGDATAPVIVRQYPGEKAVLNAALQVWGHHVWYWGFELALFTNASRYDSSRFQGLNVYGGPDVKLINLVVHDFSNGLGLWTQGTGTEAYGCLIYNNGYQGSSRGHGHGIYTQNNTPTKTIHENIIFNNFGWGLHAYGSDSASLKNFDVQGNVSFNNGSIAAGSPRTEHILFSGGQGVENVVCSNNYTYSTPTLAQGDNAIGWNGSGPNRNLVANGNYFIGGQTALNLFNWDKVEFRNNVVFSQFTPLSMGNQNGQNMAGYSWNNNTYFGADAFYHNLTKTNFAGYRSRTGLDSNSTFTSGRPTGVWKFVRPNKYDPGRAHVIIYNWSLATTVDVDLSGVLPAGSDFEIRNAQDWAAPPVVSGRYNGGNVTLPMTNLTVAQPFGAHPVDAVPTGPEFNVFIVIKR